MGLALSEKTNYGTTREVDEFQKSGQSQKDFCTEAGIKPSTFSYWIKKKRMSREPNETFLRIGIKVSVLEKGVEIIYPNGVRLKTHQRDLSVIGPDPALLMLSLGSSHSYYLYRTAAGTYTPSYLATLQGSM